MENTKNNKKITIIAIVAVLIIALGAFIYWKNEKVHQQDMQSASGQVGTSSVTATSTQGSLGVTTTSGGKVSVQQVSSEDATSTTLANAGPMPDLSHKTIFATTTQPDVVTFISGKITDLQTSLKADPTQFASWINLGLDYEAAGDYRAAADAWVYTGKLFPNNYISFGNLGDLYAYYLKDNAFAEVSFTTAIKNGPTQTNLYFEAEDLYYNIEKDPVKARAVVEQGIQANPGNNQGLIDLLQTIKS